MRYDDIIEEFNVSSDNFPEVFGHDADSVRVLNHVVDLWQYFVPKLRNELIVHIALHAQLQIFPHLHALELRRVARIILTLE